LRAEFLTNKIFRPALRAAHGQAAPQQNATISQQKFQLHKGADIQESDGVQNTLIKDQRCYRIEVNEIRASNRSTRGGFLHRTALSLHYHRLREEQGVPAVGTANDAYLRSAGSGTFEKIDALRRGHAHYLSRISVFQVDYQLGRILQSP
jgi:hypothetical protein